MSGRCPHQTFFLFLGLLYSAILMVFITIPIFNDPGTLIHLDGDVGKLDHPDLWKSFDYLTNNVYSLCDYCCHQKMDRSMILNGNQFPLCIRDMFLMVGMAIGFYCFSCNMPHIKGKMIISVILMLICPIEWYYEYFFNLNYPVLRAIVSVISGFGFPMFLSWLIDFENAVIDSMTIRD